MTDQQAIGLLESLMTLSAQLQTLSELLAATMWTCGCGTVNSVALVACRQCGRTLQEPR